MNRDYRNYTDEQIIEITARVFSLAGLLKELGLQPTGGNYSNMRRNLQRLELTCEHWKGQGWNKNNQLKDWKDYTRKGSIKKHLIKLRGHCCEKCDNKIWLSELITLEVHHIDGDRTNNNLVNLQLLCPNCHSQTKSWRRKK